MINQNLLEAVLALPPEERAELAERLRESLPDGFVATTLGQDLVREVRSRREQHLQEILPLHNWTDVRKELDEIIARFE